MYTHRPRNNTPGYKPEVIEVFVPHCLCTLLLATVCVRTVCVEAEQKNAKRNNRTWLNRLLTIGEHQHFLEEGKFVVSGASVACVVSHCCPILMVYGIRQEYCSRLLVLPDTSTYSTFS